MIRGLARVLRSFPRSFDLIPFEEKEEEVGCIGVTAWDAKKKERKCESKDEEGRDSQDTLGDAKVK